MKTIKGQKNDKIISMLRESPDDFRFNPDALKTRLMQDTRNTTQLPKPRFPQFHSLKVAALVATPVIFLSVTLTMAAGAAPGDKLFPLNKWGERIILSLPLSEQTKANLHTDIVTKRLNALIQVQPKPGVVVTSTFQNREVETVKESDESLKDAIDSITAKRDEFRAAGETDSADKLDVVLTHLESLAAEHEAEVQQIEATVPAGVMHDDIDEHLGEIKITRHKARVELNMQDDPADSD